MNTLQKVVVGIVAIAFVTTLILPGRQTTQVISATSSGFTGALKTAMGR
jgi:hypothetical protein